MEFAVAVEEQSAIGQGQPNVAGIRPIAQGIELRWVRARGVEAFEEISVAANQAAGFGADPKRAGAILPNANDAAAVEGRGVVGIENGEANAIEAREAVERREPEIAVVGLGHRDDGILRQALVGLPGVDEETGVAGGRVRRAVLDEIGDCKKQQGRHDAAKGRACILLPLNNQTHRMNGSGYVIV